MGGQGLPEFKYHPEKGLNVTIGPDMLQQLIAGIGLVKGQGPQGMPQQQMGQQGPPPILPPNQRMM